MKDLLFLSNGHGEDVIAGKVLDCVLAERPGLTVEAWPMVGEGKGYKARGVETIGAPNLLPSAGFATIDPELMVSDLKAGWIRTHWRQFRDALRLRGRYRMLIAVGDIIPLAAGTLSRAPFIFIACAKSTYYGPKHGFTGFEKWLMRRYARRTLPRDRLTAAELDAARIPNVYLGNPMMDGLEGTGDRLGVPESAIVVGMLAGTRADAEANMFDLLAAAGRVHAYHDSAASFRFVFASRPELDPADVARTVLADPRFQDCQVLEMSGAADGVVLRFGLPGGAEAIVAKGRFSDVLAMSDIVVGMAGTANEQAVGLGIPLIAVPSSGVQGERYVAMKMNFFGEAAVAVPRDPDAIARTIVEILGDPDRRARMAAAGRERMGEAGASRAIAEEILQALDRIGAGAKR